MTDPQTNRYDMNRAVLGVLDTHAAAWTAVPAMQAYRDELAALIERVRSAAQQQARTPQAATVVKAELRDAVRAQAGRLAGAVAAWARTAGRPEVATAVDVPRRELTRLRDAALAEYSEVVVAEARRHLDGDGGLAQQGVTPAVVDALDALDDEFAAALSTPREAIVARSQGTREIAAALSETAALLRDRLDPTVAFLAPDAPAFADAYRAARTIVDRGRGPASLTEDPPDDGR